MSKWTIVCVYECSQLTRSPTDSPTHSLTQQLKAPRLSKTQCMGASQSPLASMTLFAAPNIATFNSDDSNASQSSHRPRRETSVGSASAQQTILPIAERTFATSNYKIMYSMAEPARFQHDLLHAVHDMVSE